MQDSTGQDPLFLTLLQTLALPFAAFAPYVLLVAVHGVAALQRLRVDWSAEVLAGVGALQVVAYIGYAAWRSSTPTTPVDLAALVVFWASFGVWPWASLPWTRQTASASLWALASAPLWVAAAALAVVVADTARRLPLHVVLLLPWVGLTVGVDAIGWSATAWQVRTASVSALAYGRNG